jgi:tetratricopeptide (TPR) repeat protein
MRFACLSPLCIGVVSVLMGVPAHAAERNDDYPAPCDESTVSRADHDRAHSVFLSGKGFLDEDDYDKAISYFKDAYTIDCSVHGLLPIIATAYERKGDRSEAIRALGEYLSRAPHAPDREIIERRMRNLKEQLAREQPPTPAAPAPAPAPAAAPQAPTPATAAPQPVSEPSPSVAVTPVPAPPQDLSRSSGAGPAPWIVFGLGTAATAAGVGLVIGGVAEIESALSDCQNHVCANSDVQKSAAKKQSLGYTLVNVGATVGGTGVAAMIAGIIWAHASHAPSAPAPTALVSPVLSPGYGGLVFDGAF